MWDWLDLEDELRKPKYSRDERYEVYGVRFAEVTENGIPYWNEDIYGMDVMWPDYKSAKEDYEKRKSQNPGGCIYFTEIWLNDDGNLESGIEMIMDEYNFDKVYQDSYEAGRAKND